jgi:hypothetical protein
MQHYMIIKILIFLIPGMLALQGSINFPGRDISN